MLEDIEVFLHSSIKINKEKAIYIDPFKISNQYNDADIIFITHDHYDHYSIDDINKIKKEETVFVIPENMIKRLLDDGINKECIVAVEPNKKYAVNGIKFETVWAYNINKQFHPKENKWVGYILDITGIRYFIAGDTDKNEDNINVKCDIAFLPVGGTYTMNYEEAADLANEINPKVAVPIHYGSIVGNKADAEKFVELLSNKINGLIMIK